MRIVAKRLQPLNMPFAFLGGAVVHLLVDHPGLMQLRTTKDVDVIVQVMTYHEFSTFEERLRKAGFKHDTSAGAPICRWIVDECLVDIMPQAPILGMCTKWFPEALKLSREADLGEACAAKVISAPLFLAAKLTAWADRGKNDYFLSNDLQDIITVVYGRATIVEEVMEAPIEIRQFVAGSFSRLLENPDFQDALPGHLPQIVGGESALLAMQRWEAIAMLI
jgi:hypothetical protein